MKTLAELPLTNLHVLVRVDFNVPFNDYGDIEDATRIEAHRPTLDVLTQAGAKVVLISHMSDAGASLAPIAEYLSQFYDIQFCDNCIGDDTSDMIENMAPGDLLLLENTRHHAEEKLNDPAFAEQLAEHADVFINDAFGAAHRAHCINRRCDLLF